MKTTPTIFKFITINLLLMLFAFVSCNKGNNVQTSDMVTETDAAQITTDAVTPTTGGMANQSTTTAALSVTLPSLCGVTRDSTITVSSLSGTTPVYTFTFSWNYTLNCNVTTPADINYNFTGSGSYTGTYITASHTGKGQFVLTNLIDSADYILNGTYIRNGSFTSRFIHSHSFTSVITITAVNVKINRLTREIASGTSAVTIAAVAASGKSCNFSGTISYLGNKKANLVLNSGVSHLIQWL